MSDTDRVHISSALSIMKKQSVELEAHRYDLYMLYDVIHSCLTDDDIAYMQEKLDEEQTGINLRNIGITITRHRDREFNSY